VGDAFRKWTNLSFDVASITYEMGPDNGLIFKVTSKNNEHRYGKTLCIGTGRSAYIPDLFRSALSDNVVHLNHYLMAKNRWLSRLKNPHIVVVGGSQSAIEIILDLHPECKVTSISRGFPFKHKDLSSFTECIYYPSFVNYFHNASEDSQSEIISELWRSNYSAADPDVVSALNLRLYEQKISNNDDLSVHANTEILKIEESEKGYLLEIKEKYSKKRQTIKCDGVVLATGFMNFGNKNNQENFHPLMKNLIGDAIFRNDGSVSIDRNYKMENRSTTLNPAVYLNGLCETTHGFGDAGSFSLLSARADVIAESIVQEFDAVKPKQRYFEIEEREHA